MTTYWGILVLPGILAMLEGRSGHWRAVEKLAFAAFMLVLIVLIGFRNEVGGDWFAYLALFSRSAFDSLAFGLTLSDPGYILLNWIAGSFGLDIWAVNSACAAFIALGLHRFCQQQPRPWLALAAAVPYLIIVVAMGYTRQGAAIGCFLIGLAALGKGSVARYVFWTLVAATFHKSAVVMVPLAAFAEGDRKLATTALAAIVAIGAFVVLVSGNLDAIDATYIATQYSSGGALVRVLMNALPAAIFLMCFSRFQHGSPASLRFWRYLAWLALLSPVVLILSPSSTVVDRLGLYLIPLQMFVYSRLPDALFVRDEARFLAIAGVIGFLCLALFVWLNFGAHSSRWLPYNNFLY